MGVMGEQGVALLSFERADQGNHGIEGIAIFFWGEETMDEGRRFLLLQVAKPSQCGAAPYRARHARAAAGGQLVADPSFRLTSRLPYFGCPITVHQPSVMRSCPKSLVNDALKDGISSIPRHDLVGHSRTALEPGI